MQDMQALFNNLYIREFYCIYSYNPYCKACKHLSFLACIATRIFATCQCYTL